MFPNTTIYVYEAVQGMVEERIARAKHRAKIQDMMRAARARKQFRRSIVHGLRSGLGGKDLAAELCSTLRTERRN
jgi:hypothetical protein